MKKKTIISLCFGCMALVSTPALAQQDQPIKGTVVDQNGDPIIGASVRVVGKTGSNIGVITDLDGNYTINAPKGSKVNISYIGYISQTVAPGGTVKLKEDAQNLEEVVVVGYGVQKKAHLTGSVGTVPMDDIQDLSGASLASSLSGLINGLSVSGGDGRVGESSQVTIRDGGDLQKFTGNSNGPLYVIDGYVYPNDIKDLGAEAFNNLDPSEVESISVLKDASAAVYGARAANGVILVTTKKGKVGAPRISYSGTFGITDAVKHPSMLNSYDYGRLYNIMAASNPKNTSLNHTTGLYQADELEAMKDLDYDLLDKYWKTGVTQQHSVNVSGATEKVNYFAGVSYYTQEGNLGKLDYDRWNYRAGIDVKISQYLKANLNVSGNYGETNKTYVAVGGSNTENDYRYLFYRPRYIPEYVNGLPVLAYGISNSQSNGSQLYHYDLLNNHNGDFTKNNTNSMTINASLDYDFGWSKVLKGLKLRLSYSKSITNDKTNQYGSSYTLYSMTNRTGSGAHLYTPIAGEDYSAYTSADNFVANEYNNGSSSFLSRDMSRIDNYQINFTAQYQRTFGQHDISALFSIEKAETEYEPLEGKVLDPYTFTNYQSTSASGTQSTQFTRSESGSLSYIGRINYAYASKYLFEFLIRSDASTKFAPKNYWGTFPSASVGWVMSEESWFKKALPWVDFLKVRGSFGLTGRDNTAAWYWKKHYSVSVKSSENGIFGTTNTQTGTGFKASSDYNPDVHWDKSYKGNLGVDFNVLNQRLAVTLEAYYVWNRDLFMDLSDEIPATVGTVSSDVNRGRMDNWGYEASFTWRDKIGKDFKYRIGLNFGYSDNKVILTDWATTYAYKAVHKGQRFDTGSWGLECIGMFKSYQEIAEYVKKYNITSYMGLAPSDIKPGMLIYKDVRGADGKGGPNGVVSENEDCVRLSHRSSNPYGFTTNLNAEYKGFTLTAQLRASWGAYTAVPSAALKSSYGIEAANMPSFWDPDDIFVYQDVLDGSGNVVVSQNLDGTLPIPDMSGVNSAPSSFWRVNAAQVTLSRLTLAYKLPTKWFKSIGLQSARINVTGQNLLSFYNPYPNNFIDPMSTSYGSYPKLRKWTVGVNLTF